jgi:hypothetical protein
MNEQQKIWAALAATGARASARFNNHFRDTLGMPSKPALWILKRRERRAPFWTAPADRNGDGAFGRTSGFLPSNACRACKSGVALRLPPQSKFAVVIRRLTSLEERPVVLTHVNSLSN